MTACKSPRGLRLAAMAAGGILYAMGALHAGYIQAKTLAIELKDTDVVDGPGKIRLLAGLASEETVSHMVVPATAGTVTAIYGTDYGAAVRSAAGEVLVDLMFDYDHAVDDIRTGIWCPGDCVTGNVVYDSARDAMDAWVKHESAVLAGRLNSSRQALNALMSTTVEDGKIAFDGEPVPLGSAGEAADLMNLIYRVRAAYDSESGRIAADVGLADDTLQALLLPEGHETEYDGAIITRNDMHGDVTTFTAGVVDANTMENGHVINVGSGIKKGISDGNTVSGGSGAISLGRDTKVRNARDQKSIAIGDGAENDSGGISIGAVAKSYNGGVALGDGSFAKQGEVSIGNIRDGLTRKITNMADGVKDSDGATVNNVKTAIQGLKESTETEIRKLNDRTTDIEETLSRANGASQQNLKRVAEEGRTTDEPKGEGSYAAGEGAEAPGYHSVALGEKSRADRDYEVNIGLWEKQPPEKAEQEGVGGQGGSSGTVRGSLVQTTRVLSGVSDGNRDDEAVNARQLKTVATNANKAASGAKEEAVKDANKYTDDTVSKANRNVLKEANAYTDESYLRTQERANTYTNHRAAQAEDNAVARSNAYTDNRVSSLKQEVDRNEKRANGGIAGAMAMSAIPSVAGHDFSFGMALSGYRDQTAIAAGIKANITGNTSVSLNTAWDSGNGVGAAAGFAVGW